MEFLGLIFSFVVVISIIALGFGSSMHKRQIAYKERKDALERERSGSNSSASEERIKHLEDRVRVLERLATDRGTTLADEIEALRDERSDNGMPIPQQRDLEAG